MTTNGEIVCRTIPGGSERGLGKGQNVLKFAEII